MKNIFFICMALTMCFVYTSCADSPKATATENEEEVAESPAVSPDLAFFELHGPVKKVQEDYMVYEFDQNGKLTKHSGTFKFYRDSQGRIVTMEGYENHVTYLWDSQRPTGSEAAAEGMTILESYTYGERGFVEKIKHTVDGEISYETLSYSGLDKYGNWTKRSSRGYEYGRGSASRTIEYYE